MRILIADDDDVARLELEAMLTKRSHEVVAAADGPEAWEILQGEDPPRVAVLDWMMSEMDGIEVCRRARQVPRLQSVYLILLTSRGSKEHVIAGLRAGANDYITKPFDHEELHARVQVGVQMAQLQAELAARVTELEEALGRVKQLQGLLPICAYCKSIRDDQNYWHQVEIYLHQHADTHFSHGICPKCWETVVKAEFHRLGLNGPTLPEPLDHS
jgi:DNA-binding response OmpR family regulator